MKPLSGTYSVDNKKKTLFKDQDPAREPLQDPGIKAGQAKRLTEIEKARKYQAEQRKKKEAEQRAKKEAEQRAKKEANKNTVDYSVATKPKDKPVDKKTTKKALFGEGDAKTRNGKANVSRKQLDAFGGTLTQYMNQWNKSGKRPTKVSKDASGSGSGTKTDAPAKKTFRQRRAANLKAKIADENVGEGRRRRLKRRLGRVERRMAQGKAGGGEIKAKGYYQGGDARLDESLGERRGKESTKSQSMKSRRNESRGATKKKKSTPKSAGAATRGWGAVMR